MAESSLCAASRSYTACVTSFSVTTVPKNPVILACLSKTVSLTTTKLSHQERSPRMKKQFHYRITAKADRAPGTPPPEVERRSLLCPDCDGNGAVVCNQCEGGGVNKEDLFQGRFKAGQTCWLCRGKKSMLCGNCNGAGFLGGFMSTKDD